MTEVFFYLFAAIVLTFAVLAVTTRRILRAAVYLLFVLIATAVIYFITNFYFLAAVQILVYVGGIVVLIIFSILLTSHLDQRLEKPSALKVLFTTIAIIVGAIVTTYTIYGYNFQANGREPEDTSVNTIGKQLLNYGDNGYVLPFEVISILLLAAMIAAIAIAKRDKEPADD